MGHVFFALIRSFAGFSRPGLWKYLVLPPLIGLMVWLLAAFLWLGLLTDWLVAETPLHWLQGVLGDWHLGWIATVLAFIGAWVVLLSGSYLIAVVITGVWALPGIARAVAVSDYPDVSMQGRDSFFLSFWVTFKALVLYLAGWVLSLPVWLVPGMAIVHSFFWLAYLNRATFAFDALAAHATADEWRRLETLHGGRHWFLGLMAALIAHIPLLGFFAPSLAAMAFVHYGMESLRAERGLGPGPMGGMAGSANVYRSGSAAPPAGVIDGEFRREE